MTVGTGAEATVGTGAEATVGTGAKATVVGKEARARAVARTCFPVLAPSASRSPMKRR